MVSGVFLYYLENKLKKKSKYRYPHNSGNNEIYNRFFHGDFEKFLIFIVAKKKI